MNGHGKSDSAIVAKKSANKAGSPAAERMEPRAETEGNVTQQSTCRAQNRASVYQALERIRQAARTRKKEQFTALLHQSFSTFSKDGDWVFANPQTGGSRTTSRTSRSASFAGSPNSSVFPTG